MFMLVAGAAFGTREGSWRTAPTLSAVPLCSRGCCAALVTYRACLPVEPRLQRGGEPCARLKASRVQFIELDTSGLQECCRRCTGMRVVVCRRS